jgi:hypothetical protein
MLATPDLCQWFRYVRLEHRTSEGCGNKGSWFNLEYYSGIRLDGLRETTNTCYSSLLAGCNFNSVPSEKDARMLSIVLRSLYGGSYKHVIFSTSFVCFVWMCVFLCLYDMKNNKQCNRYSCCYQSLNRIWTYPPVAYMWTNCSFPYVNARNFSLRVCKNGFLFTLVFLFRRDTENGVMFLRLFKNKSTKLYGGMEVNLLLLTWATDEGNDRLQALFTLLAMKLHGRVNGSLPHSWLSRKGWPLLVPAIKSNVPVVQPRA